MIGAFAALASYALFHLVTVFPLSWVALHASQAIGRFNRMYLGRRRCAGQYRVESRWLGDARIVRIAHDPTTADERDGFRKRRKWQRKTFDVGQRASQGPHVVELKFPPQGETFVHQVP